MTTTKNEPPAKLGRPIFVSHVSADDVFIRQLRKVFEARHLPVWVDSREMHAVFARRYG